MRALPPGPPPRVVANVAKFTAHQPTQHRSKPFIATLLRLLWLLTCDRLIDDNNFLLILCSFGDPGSSVSSADVAEAIKVWQPSGGGGVVMMTVVGRRCNGWKKGGGFWWASTCGLWQSLAPFVIRVLFNEIDARKFCEKLNNCWKGYLLVYLFFHWAIITQNFRNIKLSLF